MKYVSLIVFTLLAFVFVAGCSSSTYEEPFPSDNLFSSSDNTVLLLFHGYGCPHCHAEIEYLKELKVKYPNLEIRSAETWRVRSNANLFQQLAKKYGKEANGVPGTFIGDKMFIGFSDEIKSDIENEIESCKTKKCDNPLLKLRNN